MNGWPAICLYSNGSQTLVWYSFGANKKEQAPSPYKNYLKCGSET